MNNKFGSRLDERITTKDFQHNLVHFFMPVIESKFTFFKMIIERLFLDSSELRESVFAIIKPCVFSVSNIWDGNNFIILTILW